MAFIMSMVLLILQFQMTIAERAVYSVQTFKEGMKRCSVDCHDFCFTTELLCTALLISYQATHG